jgi:CubicO group peptidase (beta-lactamase class C family)
MGRPGTLLLAFVLAGSHGCATRQQPHDGAGYVPGASWRTSTPEEQGIDSVWLQRMLEDVRTNGTDVDGIVIVRHGHLVFESYTAPYHAGTPHNLKSTSKSVLSALVGIALREGTLTGLDQRLSEVFPELFVAVDDPRKRELTVRHLLTMTAGFAWEENSPASDRLWESDDWVRDTIRLPLRDPPGVKFTYSTALTHLASAAIARRSGMSTRAFAERHLFDPLGIHAGPWRRDPRGIHRGGSDLFLTPRDAARFGLLYLRHGLWNGRQVVPRAWVVESTRRQVGTGGWEGLPESYGYWWWIERDASLALGLGGQVLVVAPAQDLVVVFTCAASLGVPAGLYRRYVAPALRPAPLQPNPEAQRAIAALTRELEEPRLVEAPLVPGPAARISGRSFRLEPNPFGFTGIGLRCADARTCSLVVETPGERSVLPVGLDGRYRVSEPTGLGDLPFASRGAWESSASGTPTFVLSVVPVGDPVRMAVRLTFEGEGVSLSIVRRSFDVREWKLAGTAASAVAVPPR